MVSAKKMYQDSHSASLFRMFVNGAKLLKEGYLRVFLKEFRKRLRSCSTSLGLRRDLEEDFHNPDARISISVRPIKEGDFASLTGNGKLFRKYPKILQDREHLLQANIPTCFVAVTEDDEPCYMQWLISSKENKKMQEVFGNSFPVLNENEALLEAAYMQPSFRGLRIMPAAMARIAEEAREFEAKWTLTFVDIENIPSLKGCHRSGFSPYILRTDRWFLFRRTITFDQIPSDLLEQYHHLTGNDNKTSTNSFSRKSSMTESSDPV